MELDEEEEDLGEVVDESGEGEDVAYAESCLCQTSNAALGPNFEHLGTENFSWNYWGSTTVNQCVSYCQYFAWSKGRQTCGAYGAASVRLHWWPTRNGTVVQFTKQQYACSDL